LFSLSRHDVFGPKEAVLENEPRFLGADDGARTRDPQLGKLMLYQLSYVRPIGPKIAQSVLKSGPGRAD
jgi:hypothetical protein